MCLFEMVIEKPGGTTHLAARCWNYWRFPTLRFSKEATGPQSWKTRASLADRFRASIRTHRSVAVSVSVEAVFVSSVPPLNIQKLDQTRLLEVSEIVVFRSNKVQSRYHIDRCADWSRNVWDVHGQQSSVRPTKFVRMSTNCTMHWKTWALILAMFVISKYNADW